MTVKVNPGVGPAARFLITQTACNVYFNGRNHFMPEYS